MAKMGAKGIKNGEKVEKVEMVELECFGGFMDEDPFCEECEEVVFCKERAKELMKEFSEESVEDEDSDKEDLQETEEEVQDKIEESSGQDDLQKIEEDFDPRNLNLTGENRIDILCELNVDQLIQVAEDLEIEISHIDQEKEDVSNEIILEIDTFIEESEEEAEAQDSEVQPEVIKSQEIEEHEPEVQSEEKEEDALDEEEKFTSMVLCLKKDINNIGALYEKKFLEYDSKIATLESLLKQTIGEVEERDLKIAELGIQLGHIGKRIDPLEKEGEGLGDRVESLSDFYMKNLKGIEKIQEENSEFVKAMSDNIKALIGRIAACEKRFQTPEPELEKVIKGIEEPEKEKETTIMTRYEMLEMVKVSINNLNNVVEGLSHIPKIPESESEEVIEETETKVEDPVVEEQKTDEIIEGQQESEESDQEPNELIPQFFVDQMNAYPEEIEFKKLKDRVSAKIKGKKTVLASIINRGSKKMMVLNHAKHDCGLRLKFQGKPAISVAHPKALDVLVEYLEDLQ